MMPTMKTESADFGANAVARGVLSTQRRKAATAQRRWGDPAAFGRRRKAPRHAAVVVSASLLLCVFALIPPASHAATNDLTSALQRGLFEEEANHNLEAAAQAYQAVSARFDQDRKLAATAIFRLGEVYRKQGKTNEASAQYERIVREFSDQQTLVTLSRQNLAGLDSTVTTTGLQKTLAEEQEVGRLGAQLGGIEKLKDKAEEQARAVLAFFPDETLKKMLLNLPRLKEQEAILRANPSADRTMQFAILGTKLGGYLTSFGPDGPVPEAHYTTNLVADTQLELRNQLSMIKERVDFNVGVQKARLHVLQTAAAITPAREVAAAGQPASTTDDEDAEIRRIKAMIQNSPDLINAPRGEAGTPLFLAVFNGQLRVATFLLDHGATVNTPAGRRGKIEEQWTPLITAANGGHKAMAELLLQRGADVQATDGPQGSTPLHFAAKNGFAGVAEVLVAHKAKVNATGKDGATPLQLAAGAGHVGLIELLLRNGAQVNLAGTSGRTPLHEAVASGQTAAVKILLAAKADPNLPGDSGVTPLGSAARGHRDIVPLLLAANADPNAGQKDLPLVAAAQAGQLEIAELLLRAGAKPDLASKTSQPSSLPGQPYLSSGPREYGPYTPLQVAVAKGSAALARLLFQFKADANAKDAWTSPRRPLIFQALTTAEMLKAFLDGGADPNVADGGQTPLVVTATDSWPTRLPDLIAHGVNVNVRAPGGESPLQIAFRKEDVTAVKLLLDAKADPNVRGDRFPLPLQMAITRGSKELAEALIAHGADVNGTNDWAWTPLHFAAAYGRKEIATFLLAKGANPNVRNNEGWTPLDLTKPQSGGPVTPVTGEPPRAKPAEMAELLRQHGALDDLPNLDRIEVRRPSANFSAVAFQMGTNGWNEFSLLETIALHYGLISTERNAIWEVNVSTLPSKLWRAAGCQFPDLDRVVIRRAASAGPQRTELAGNVAQLLDSGDCARDLKLKPGDIIEIPEADHPVNEKWAGLGGQQWSNLLHCISRTVTISIKGTPTTNRLAPEFKLTNSQGAYGEWMGDLTRGSFMLKSVLAQSRLIRASSDLSQVKVTRHVGVNGKPQEWVLNCSSGNDPDLWLRDGDVIEVPDKP